MSDQQHPAFDPSEQNSLSESTAKVHPASQSSAEPELDDRRITPVEKPSASPPDSNPLQSMLEMGGSIGMAIGDTALKTGKAAVDTATGVGESVSKTASETGKIVLKTTSDLGEIVTSSASQTGKAAVDAAAAVGGALGNTAIHTSQAIAEIATSMGEAAAKQIYQLLEQSTKGAGHAATYVSQNPVTKAVSGVLKLDWIAGISDRVDLEKAKAAVHKLQQKYPHDSPNQIAHRIMVQKAMMAGGMGFFSSILPGFATALLAVDLAATTALQTEMVYQISAAYGMDLNDPARKGEVLGIFGLALGGRSALKAGLAFLRNVPVAGSMIGASTNATMLYSLGYAACRFYEVKQSDATSTPTPEVLEEIKQASEKYLDVAASQQVLMDQILVHMILASYPQKTWEDIVPELKSLQLNETSVEAIAKDIGSPRPLGTLLDQLNRDFAVPLLAQCRRIAESHDGDVSPAEAELMEAIARRFEVDLDAMQAEVAETRVSG